MVAHGSSFPAAKLVLNNSVPPILMASLRMLLVFLILIPFWKFRLPERKFFKPLIIFSISMGVLVYLFMNLSIKGKAGLKASAQEIATSRCSFPPPPASSSRPAA